ncbi:Carbonic anhydrase 1 [Caligus rogercresseyi]|uniref:carbonic anhydrase n=1 Tax=Caligus rogercresseyi TaxID=217165 RepID=A0A7T8GND6_CALRO|nr:Carbonic anhydrase 1 [Caligus rogercresseyi]
MEGVSDNLAVLGILFDIIPCSVVELNTLVSELANIKNPQSKASISGLTLERFLPTDTDTFFSYSGSLTTPKCQEIVSWTVFKVKKKPITFFSSFNLNIYMTSWKG